MKVFKIGILKNYLRMKFLKLNLKIRILKNYLKMEVLIITFENWNFGKLFENESFENWNFEELFENEIKKKKI